MGDREAAFEALLRPITWPWDSSIGFRKDLVDTRRNAVRLVFPFLTEAEKIKANEWLKKEQHLGLWD